MGDVLAGTNAVWEFEPDAVVIRYSRGARGARLLHALGERRVPHAALASVDLEGGRRGHVVLRAVPRAGADPLVEAAGGQLKDSADPYRLVVPEEFSTLAEYYRDELRAKIGGPGEALSRFLVDGPAPPRSFKAYDAKALFDGRTVSFRWFWTGASSAKWKAGDQSFPVEELTGVDWRSPEMLHGYLRLLRRDGGGQQPGEPDQDPAAVVFGLGYGPVHESLPFAAAVLAAIRSARVRPQT
ncbi:DUF4429 domain-containing protein [Streptomyces cocklensis]|jgi:hypothetical protein|uniref:DUF4429 domain-containing protein n=1 Tax=Actinacidiphila cocklensis TaxID=887465 RepID=A0A9W4GQM5_9ACTN|nr:DUF4429 domain-containing protein [Actinacidiphila cocklensis]MDD1057950.1 DUF4429 domain-containing protein [Actinacidiphila cocklensis]WSX74328.1 DUF4429 domain-containing protein [Streptomyces sp. NBC_00899]WSX79607.1 DUF4429 domain-containing protein [Streptomyces sp. NBC_00899]CAG6392819.1 conserved hypothetical protein [Actinacidiphila cocklensis]